MVFFGLYAQILTCDLIFISKLTRDLNCATKFYPNLCEFQVVDMGKESGTLIDLVDSICSKKVLRHNIPFTNYFFQFIFNFMPNLNENKVILRYLDLDHPNFVLKSYFLVMNWSTCQAYQTCIFKHLMEVVVHDFHR